MMRHAADVVAHWNIWLLKVRKILTPNGQLRRVVIYDGLKSSLSPFSIHPGRWMPLRSTLMTHTQNSVLWVRTLFKVYLFQIWRAFASNRGEAVLLVLFDGSFVSTLRTPCASHRVVEASISEILARRIQVVAGDFDENDLKTVFVIIFVRIQYKRTCDPFERSTALSLDWVIVKFDCGWVSTCHAMFAGLEAPGLLIWTLNVFSGEIGSSVTRITLLFGFSSPDKK